MAGINDTDIRLDDTWQLTAAATGDAPTCTGLDCFIQDIQLEAISKEGELFYDSEWGWGLVDFLHTEDDSLTRLEISERVKQKLRRRPEIVPTSINIEISFVDDLIRVIVSFYFTDSEIQQALQLQLNRVNVEVVLID